MATIATDQSASSDGGNLREVEIVLEGVETPRRHQNSSDKRLGIVRHKFDVPVRALEGLHVYSGANPRKRPKVKSRVARLIERSLLNQDTVSDAFHLAHLGITVVATEFEKVDEREDVWRLKFLLDESTESGEDEPKDGIVNGSSMCLARARTSRRTSTSRSKSSQGSRRRSVPRSSPLSRRAGTRSCK
jgi:hypothetical protein